MAPVSVWFRFGSASASGNLCEAVRFFNRFRFAAIPASNRFGSVLGSLTPQQTAKVWDKRSSCLLFLDPGNRFGAGKACLPIPSFPKAWDKLFALSAFPSFLDDFFGGSHKNEEPGLILAKFAQEQPVRTNRQNETTNHKQAMSNQVAKTTARAVKQVAKACDRESSCFSGA